MRSYKRKRRMVQDYKASVGCEECGESDSRALDLHHVDPSTKHASLSPVYRENGKPRRGGNTWSSMRWDELVEELRKCRVLCANCHRKVTHPRPSSVVRHRRSGKEESARVSLGLTAASS